MATPLEIATKYVKAVSEGNIDNAIRFLKDNASLTVPVMGTLEGKEAIKSTLGMVGQFGAKISAPKDGGGSISADVSSPMGNGKLVFSFDGSLISKMELRM